MSQMLIERAKKNFRKAIIKGIFILPIYSLLLLYAIGRWFFPLNRDGYFIYDSINISILTISLSLPLILFIRKRSSIRMLSMSVQNYGNAYIEIDNLESELEAENNELTIGDKGKQKYFITKNYLLDWNEVGYSSGSILKIENIERIKITGIRETRRSYYTKATIYDAFGKEMEVSSRIETSDWIKSRKRDYARIVSDNETINSIIASLQERNVSIEIIRNLASEEVIEPTESSWGGQNNSKILAVGDFHFDESQNQFIENGKVVDQFGRRVRS